ncbi:MAG TPA: hypothetical protein VGJ09_12900 [Bryobacteraceae bacterium]|jgi:hypothetical protein
MKYQVVGANAESGDDVNVTLDALSRHDVEKLAHEKGILVSSITLLPPPAKNESAIGLVEDEPPAANGNGAEPHGRAAGVITVNANSPSDTAHSAEGRIAEMKHGETAMEYHVIMNQSLYLLETAVNKHLRDGWEPAGGLAVGVSNNAMQYFQAVCRRKK